MSAVLSLDDPVSMLNFTPRPRKALTQLRVKTVRDLLALDVTRVLLVPGCGIGTAQQVEETRRWLAADLVVSSPDKTIPNPSDASDAGFYGDVVRLLPTSVVRVLKQFGIKTLLDFLSLTPARARAIDGLTYRAWQDIQRVQRLCRHRQAIWAAHDPPRPAAADEKNRSFNDLVATLGRKATRVLRIKDVRTEGDLLKLTKTEVRAIPGVGIRTWLELQGVQERLVKDVPEPYVSLTFSEAAVRRFPLFTGRPATAPASALGEAFCPHDSVNELDLPKRAAGGLRDFGLRTIGELLCTQNLALKKSGNFGEGSLLTVQTAVLQHILRRNGLLEENPLDLTSCSETPENVVRRFPLFTGRPATAPASALGEAFCPHDSVNELDLPKRAAGGLRDFGLRTIGELLCTQNLALKKSGNFGEGSLLTVQQAVLQHILRRNGLLEEKPLDLTSWQGLVQDLLTRCIRNDHERAALADKRGLLTNKPRTLKAIGQQRGFTRERVRQLVLTACRHLQSNQARRLVAPFLTLVKDLVAEARGRRPCDALAADVATRLSWSVAPSGFALAGLLDPLTGGEAWARGYVTADSLRRSCPVVRGVLSGLVLDRVEVSPREASPGGTAFLEPPSAAIVTGRQAELKRQSLRGRDPKRRSQQVTSGQLHHERGQLLRPELSRQQAAFAERCRVMKALAHEKRLAILYLLQGGPRFFAELAAATELSGQQLDNHLHVLRLLQLLTVRREEGCKKYGLNPGKAKMLAGIIGENA